MLSFIQANAMPRSSDHPIRPGKWRRQTGPVLLKGLTGVFHGGGGGGVGCGGGDRTEENAASRCLVKTPLIMAEQHSNGNNARTSQEDRSP